MGLLGPNVPGNRENLSESDELKNVRFGEGKWQYPADQKPTADYPAEFVRKDGGNAHLVG